MHKVEVILRVGRGGWRVRQRGGRVKQRGKGGWRVKQKGGGGCKAEAWRVESEAEGCGEWGKGGGGE